MKLLMLGTCAAAMVGVAQIDPVTYGAQLARLGVTGVLGTVVVGLTIALTRKDKAVTDMLEKQQRIAENIASALQRTADCTSRQTEICEQMVKTADESTQASRAVIEAVKWCQRVAHKVQ